jgi:hypothetical protein
MILSIRPHASVTIENFSRSADLAHLENPKSNHSVMKSAQDGA